MRFNWHYLLYSLFGLGEIFVGTKNLITRRGHGILVGDYSGSQAIIAGTMDIAFGLILVCIPFLIRTGQRRKARRAAEYTLIILMVFAIEVIASWIA